MTFLGDIKNRILGLDILRAVAILLVIYGHGALFVPQKFIPYYKLPFPAIDGVSIFFVLSGYLIGKILFKIIQNSELKPKDLLNFWIRRWFRTLPNYFLILGILLAIPLLKSGIIAHDFNWKYLLFLQNFSGPHPNFFPEAWSLCIEEWFYLLFPIACFINFKLFKNKKKAVLFSALFFLIVPLALRLFCYFFNIGTDFWDANFRKVTIFRLDSLMYGIIGAYLANFKNNYWIKYKNICLVLGLAILVGTSIYTKIHGGGLAYSVVWRYNIKSMASLLLLPFFSEIKTIRFKKIALVFTFISLISYSMYLINLTIVQGILIPKTIWLLGLKENGQVSLLALKYLLLWFYTISVSYLIYRFYEKPITDLRDKIKFNNNKN